MTGAQDLLGDMRPASSGMGSHHSAAMLKDEWLTPPSIIKHLGPFDLDPCSPIKRPWDTARMHFNALDDGLSQPWAGRVWLNPPYGLEAARWLERLVDHGNGIALIFARTETEMFFEHVWKRAAALLFIRGRLHFHHVDGRRAVANAGAPSVLIAYGAENAHRLEMCGIEGAFVSLKNKQGAPAISPISIEPCPVVEFCEEEPQEAVGALPAGCRTVLTQAEQWQRDLDTLERIEEEEERGSDIDFFGEMGELARSRR